MDGQFVEDGITRVGAARSPHPKIGPLAASISPP